MTYYRPHSDPQPGARLTVDWEQPAFVFDDGSMMLRHLPGSRTRLIFEGESPFIDRIMTAARETVEGIRAEIKAGL